MPEPLTEKNVRIDDVSFEIRKLLPMEAYRVLELMRPSLKDVLTTEVGEVQGGAQDGAPMVGMATLVKAVSAIPDDVVEKVRQQMFHNVFYTSAATPTAERLLGHEDTAFKDLDAIHIYEMLLRCLAVNFRGSWDAIQSRTPQAAQDTLLSTQGI